MNSISIQALYRPVSSNEIDELALMLPSLYDLIQLLQGVNFDGKRQFGPKVPFQYGV